jgi:hypothetical protein
MIKQIVRPLMIITLYGVILVLTAWPATLINKPQEQASQNLSQEVRPKTMLEAAQERDVELVSSDCMAEFSDLSSLSINSSTIVVGRIIEAQASFSKDGHHISTICSVEVERVLKATAPIPVPLEFIGFGGVVIVNGHRAVYKQKGYDKLIIGKRYVLFLEWIQRGSYYILSGGVSGLFSIDEKLIVQSHASDINSELRMKYSGINLESFVSEVMLSK